MLGPERHFVVDVAALTLVHKGQAEPLVSAVDIPVIERKLHAEIREIDLGAAGDAYAALGGAAGYLERAVGIAQIGAHTDLFCVQSEALGHDVVVRVPVGCGVRGGRLSGDGTLRARKSSNHCGQQNCR